MSQLSVLVDDTGRARLADFGLSRIVSDFGSATSMTGGFSVRWAAPEVLNMETSVTKESDIYSFGMMVVEVRVDNARPR